MGLMLLIFHQIKKNFKDIGIPADVKYIDPTYMIRACRANASDGILCTVLGQNAVSHSDHLLLTCLVKMCILLVPQFIVLQC